MPLLSKESRLPSMYANSHINFTTRLESHTWIEVVDRSRVEIKSTNNVLNKPLYFKHGSLKRHEVYMVTNRVHPQVSL